MSGYESDFALWSKQQSTLLRRLAAGEQVNAIPDWENIAEEIESLGRSEARELASRIASILLHLMKLDASPADEPRRGWRQTVRQQRDEVERLLADSPSLRTTLATVIGKETAQARLRAAADLTDYGEQPRIDPKTLSYTAEQVTGDWFPTP